jgi:hypothetical protein
MRLRVFGLACLAAVVMGAARIPDVRVVLIVNSANPASTMRRERVAKIFFRQIDAWDNGEEILPVDQIERSPARIVFARDVQGLTVRALKMYWQRQIFTGAESPPPERVTDSDVLTYVRSNSGAIGYVLEGTDLGTGVKPLELTELLRDATAVRSPP